MTNSSIKEFTKQTYSNSVTVNTISGIEIFNVQNKSQVVFTNSDAQGSRLIDLETGMVLASSSATVNLSNVRFLLAIHLSYYTTPRTYQFSFS